MNSCDTTAAWALENGGCCDCPFCRPGKYTPTKVIEFTGVLLRAGSISEKLSTQVINREKRRMVTIAEYNIVDRLLRKVNRYRRYHGLALVRDIYTILPLNFEEWCSSMVAFQSAEG